MDAVLRPPGATPDRKLNITRRIFIQQSLMSGAAIGAATCGLFPIINGIEVAYGAETPFTFAWISDTHLYPRDLNTRFVDKTVRAIEDVKAMNPAADFLIFGGDIAQLGDPVELDLGNELFKELSIRKVFIPGEHDWYLDMGKKWEALFGDPNWTFDHKGVRFIGLDTISRAPDYWTAKNMSPQERMAHMSVLDGTVAGAWSGVGRDQLDWMEKVLSDWDKARPVIVFSHNPLYEYYPPWNFWIRDWREVQAVLAPFSNVTNIHGHVHQALYNEIGTMRSIGMLATSWPWPYAPQGVPVLTTPMIRTDPGNHFDGVGWNTLTFDANGRTETTYNMWDRTQPLATAAADDGTSNNQNQKLHPRIADNQWPY
jgi:3',5'-cyclic AMP phosphodiesterase CpdA